MRYRDIFVKSGMKGGSTKGPTKRRGDADYYRKLQAKADAARKAKKKEEQNGK